MTRLAELQSLETLEIRAKLTVSSLRRLNGLMRLSSLRVSGLVQDNSMLDLGRLTKLEDLSLFCAKDSSLRDEDLACLAKLRKLKRLQTGSLRSPTVITDAGMAHVKGLIRLENLSIGGPAVTDGGMAYLHNLRRLQHLYITGNFSDAGLRHLEGLKGLRNLRIYSAGNFSPAAREQLQRNLPNLATFTADNDRSIAAGPATRPAGTQPASAHPKRGTPAPDFTVTTLDGKEFTLSQQHGKVVLVHFWATWCRPCMASLPATKRLEEHIRQKYGERVVLLNLSMDDTDKVVRAALTEKQWSGLHVRIGMHSRLAAGYGVTGAPDNFMIGPDGRILLNRESPEGPGDTEAVIDKALKGA